MRRISEKLTVFLFFVFFILLNKRSSEPFMSLDLIFLIFFNTLLLDNDDSVIDNDDNNSN